MSDRNEVFDIWRFEVYCVRSLWEVVVGMLLLRGES